MSRRSRFCLRAFVWTIAALIATVLRAQTPSLGDVARKEAERRKAQPPAAKVYTNKDLPPSAQKPAIPAPSDTQGTIVDPVAAATEQKPEGAKEEKPEEK